jgi:hypothetical protein
LSRFIKTLFEKILINFDNQLHQCSNPAKVENGMKCRFMYR